MSVFDRIDYLSSQAKPKEEEPKQFQMPKLTLADIDAMQQEEVKPIERKKPGPKPKVKTPN